MPQSYMECKHTSRIPANFYNPAMEKPLLEIIEKAKDFREKLLSYKNMPLRVQTVAVRLLILHTQFIEKLAAVMAIKCLGKDEEAKAASKAFFNDFGKNELAWERYYDHKQMVQALSAIFSSKSHVER